MKPFILSRRTLLRGSGIAIALPTLDAMMDGRGRWYGIAEAATPPPVRVMAFHFPHGVVPAQWVPTATGLNYPLSPSLMPLAAFQKDFNVITGLLQACWPKGPGGGHANGVPEFATAVVSNGIGAGGPSFEQVLAAEFGAATKFRALVANNEPPSTDAEGATSAHCNNISWTGPGTPALSERDPLNFFMTLVSATTASGAPPSPEVLAAAARKKSVLDHVLGELGHLQTRVGSADKARLDQHTASLREIERMLAEMPTTTTTGGECQAPAPIADPTLLVDPTAAPAKNEIGDGSAMPRPVGIASCKARAEVFLRLFATAFRCDLTRYASFAMSNAFYDRRAPEFGAPNVGLHQITHGVAPGGPGATQASVEAQFVAFFTGLLAFLLDQLKSTPEGAGTLLDNSLIYLGSEISIGSHSGTNMPVVLAGRGGGAVVTGRHLAFPGGTPLAKLFLAILKFGGSKTATFGQGGDAPLDGLTT
jgi:Protein of unknown function (DUF1552)